MSNEYLVDLFFFCLFYSFLFLFIITDMSLLILSFVLRLFKRKDT